MEQAFLDHQFIDENTVVERYLKHGLAPHERRAFEQHLVDCPECSDRLLLAEMFLLRNGSVRAAYPAATIVEKPEESKAEEPEPQGGLAPQSPAKAMEEEWRPRIYKPEVPLEAPRLPLRARVAAALTPWQLFLLFVLMAILLLAIPTAGILLTEHYYAGSGTRSIDTRR